MRRNFHVGFWEKLCESSICCIFYSTSKNSLISFIRSDQALDEHIVKELLSAYNRGRKRIELRAYANRYTLDDEEKAIIKWHLSLYSALKRVKHKEFVLSERNKFFLWIRQIFVIVVLTILNFKLLYLRK